MKRIFKELAYLVLGACGMIALLGYGIREIGKSIVEGSIEGLNKAKEWKRERDRKP